MRQSTTDILLCQGEHPRLSVHDYTGITHETRGDGHTRVGHGGLMGPVDTLLKTNGNLREIWKNKWGIYPEVG